MASSGSSFQRVYTGWSGHLGKIAPLVITISQPQQRLLYTPNFSFTWPLCGTVCDASYHTHPGICTLAHVGPTLTRTHFESLVCGIGLPLGAKMDIEPAKNIRSAPGLALLRSEERRVGK